ncbi:MAG: YbaB/EbfC family nucleoid-associated protein [Fibrobacteraceae bacterium]|nr:YbaB/EbfC family nucleoid-associated protein [Fibrobacteraceae bacterium]MEE1276841.1 YbaB/EbfC family nucleoid-associated protein [Fibrobacteraceae bacterium]
MNMQKMLKDLQKMQSQMLKAQNNLKAQSFEAEAGGGMVKVAINGQGVLTMIKINPDAVDKDDVEALEDLVMAALNSAIKKKDEAAQSSLNDLTQGMKIPGLM